MDDPAPPTPAEIAAAAHRETLFADVHKAMRRAGPRATATMCQYLGLPMPITIASDDQLELLADLLRD